MLSCPLCRTEWCITSKLCDKCNKVKHLMDIYSRDKVIEILEHVLVVEKFKEKEEEKKQDLNTNDALDKPKLVTKLDEKDYANDIKDYDNPEKIPESEAKEYLTRRKADINRKKSKK